VGENNSGAGGKKRRTSKRNSGMSKNTTPQRSEKTTVRGNEKGLNDGRAGTYAACDAGREKRFRVVRQKFQGRSTEKKKKAFLN